MPELFDIKPLRHGTAEVEVLAAVTAVRTPPEQWAYAISYPRTAAARDAVAVVIRIALHVTSGTVGVGCLNVDGTAFVDEIFVGAGASPTVAELVVADASILGDLVVRNGSAHGGSAAHVLSIEISVIDDSDHTRHPPLSEPHPMRGWSRYYSGSSSNAVERLRVKRFEELSAPRTITWIDGTSLIIRPHDQLSRAVYVSGTYEPNTLSILRVLTPTGGVFVDVGANVGVVSIAGAAWVGRAGRVFSFEPSHREFQRLAEHLSLNHLEHVVAIPEAVSDCEGDVTLNVASGGFAGLNTLAGEFAYAGVPAERVERVASVTLDAFVEHQHLDRMDVLKIDVEGAEGAVLGGAAHVLRSLRPAIVAEVFSRALASCGWDRTRLSAVLKDAGYIIFGIDDSTARLRRLGSLEEVDEQNIVALAEEHVDATLRRLEEAW